VSNLTSVGSCESSLAHPRRFKKLIRVAPSHCVLAHRSAEDVSISLPADHLPLPVAFEVLFSTEERDEIGYEGFLSDIDAIASQSPATSAAAALRSISLEEALAYLRSEQ